MKELFDRCKRFFCCSLAVLSIAAMAAGCAHTAGTSYMEQMSNDSRSRGSAAFASGDRVQALERFREALRIDRSVDNSAGELLDLISLGRVYTSLGRYSEATGFLNDAVALGVKTRDYALLSEAHAVFARAEYLAGFSGTALDHIDDAIQIDSGLGVRSGAKLNLKGQIFIEAGRLDEAADIINEALGINLASGDSVRTADSYRSLGDLHASLNSPELALSFYEKAYRIDHPAGDSARIAADLVKMAELNLALGDRAAAAALLEQSYVVSFNGGDRGDAAVVLDRVINVYTDLGNSGKAAFYRKVKAGFGSGGQYMAR